MFTIEKGVPLPSASNAPDHITQAMKALDVGESIVVRDVELNYRALRVRVARLHTAGGKRYATRREGNATRVWRVSLEPTDDLA